jgi:SAM-dependent methyltransferase
LSGISLLRRVERRARIFLQGRLRLFDVAVPLVEGKAGLEIGGPSSVFRERPGRLNREILPIYDRVASLDNCDFSSSTVWAEHRDRYVFSKSRAPGRSIFCDASDLSTVADQSYDFVLSSHNLEHFANPIKALEEWKRVTRPNGGFILVLPYCRNTFDHRRPVTKVEHMLEDYASNMGEDDLTHLPEILQLHDLSMDPPAGSPEQFRQRSENNFSNRCLHHHVFDQNNSRELLSSVGIEVLAVELAVPHHIFLVGRFPSERLTREH